MRLFLLLCAVASSWAQALPEVKDWNSVRVTLEHSRCPDVCSVFGVALSGDGFVQYEGVEHVAVLGRHTDRIARAGLQALLDKFRVAGFWSLPEMPATAFDTPGRVLTLTIDGESKSVFYGDGAQDKVMERLVRAVEASAQVDQWVFGNSTTVAALRRENFDWNSEEAGRVLARVAYWGRAAALRDLIAVGAPLDVRDTEFCPIALECAVYLPHVDDVEVLRLLITAGASRGDQATKNRALELAKRAKAAEAVRILREYGAKD